MMVIIDTHVLLWMLYDVQQLSAGALKALSENDSCISIASLWEMSIKQTLSKITLPHTIPEIADKCRQMGVDIIPITPEHCQRIQTLPLYHNDPFDRIIMAQSLVDRRPLVTRDKKIWDGYPEIDKIW
jgi:PIN domain nuclease of toxin-antitoxin system